MDSFTKSFFVVQQPGSPQDPNVKTVISGGMETDVSMSDFAANSNQASSVGPYSSRPPSTSQVDATPGEESAARSSAAARASSKRGTSKLIKKTNRKGAGGRTRGGRTRGGRSRGGRKAGGASWSRPGKKAATTGSQASVSSPQSEPMASSEAEGSNDEADESDHGPYCICRGPDDHRWMISCDMCDDWFHGECVSITKAIGDTLIQRYVCPRCTDDQGVNVTRYKKTCSLDGCLNSARIYQDVGADGDGNYSVFCSERHADDWWEQLVRSLPENKSPRARAADLTREKFMGLLNVSTHHKSAEGEEPWHFGKRPFAVPSEFWSQVDHTDVFTTEEQILLAASAADRYGLAEEIVLNKKMQQLLELANERRKDAIAAGYLEKDACGYDGRLDLVGSCPEEFSAWLKSAVGEAVFQNNSLVAEGCWAEEQTKVMKDAAKAKATEKGWDAYLATAGMCDRRRCKPHAGWYNIFSKSTRHLIKELTRQAKEKVDAETRIKDAAATRYFRRRRERTAVTRLDGGAKP